MPTVSETEAVELAYDFIKTSYPDVDSIISAGGETFMVYGLDAAGKVSSVQAGNKCASGTGEFFLQQIKRMQLTIAEAIDLAVTSEPYAVAGRCSVFCKSDCTHALNKGVEKGAVSAGLCKMMADRLIELLRRAKARRVLMVGGVSRNPAVMCYLQEAFPELCIPKEAPCFEALGALLWAERNGTRVENIQNLIKTSFNSFPVLPGLKDRGANVSFMAMPKGQFYEGEYIFGLDVGSTTTKAVLVRRDNFAIVASAYLRTNGDPVGASQACYRSIFDQTPHKSPLRIVGFGVTGSGRQIAGLHALTRGVINEIIAHAAAAAYFDPEVETVFEIGGQDAKYTQIVNGVACDYAMNEACSAGTGSFLEEACRESLGIETSQIADLALDASGAPDFNDQCAAFIGSDIQTAIQEGISRNNIAAGLVYSVCRNYLNRVKGNRPVGKKIFMQGGVCYNRAIPLAMAILSGREIIVPPEPGLMGAFGAALEVHQQIEAGLLEKRVFDLADLADRKVKRGAPFVCNGGMERCDRKCTISRICVTGKTFPFGGACNKYYNLVTKTKNHSGGLDLVKNREEFVYTKFAPRQLTGKAVTVGIPTSLLTNTFYPLYAHFFSNLGFRTLPSTGPDPAGMEAAGSAFCFPVILAHGFLGNLLKQPVDYIFIPHVKSTPEETSDEKNCTCPLVQGEPYYLKATFHKELAAKLVTEVLNFKNQNELSRAFVSIGAQVRVPKGRATWAFNEAWRVFTTMQQEMKARGRSFLASLHPNETALVLFGRPYNAFSKFGNMGIPQKFASRGYKIIPHDFLPLQELGGTTVERMYWGAGQGILQAARYVRQHPKLSGVFMTNFSCGPDSFITTSFRTIMGEKPSLILELDAHTSDAGVDTRIEAFLEVVKRYLNHDLPQKIAVDFSPAQTVVNKGRHVVRSSEGKHYRLTDPKVHVLVPSMGDSAAKGVAASMNFVGIRATAVEPPGAQELMLGRGEASCKECLPLFLTTGSLKRYLRERDDNKEILVYFFPEASGPCRFGRYSVFLKEFVRRNRLNDVALLSLSCESGYAGVSATFARRARMAITISDGLDDIYAGILALAENPGVVLGAFEESKARVIESIARDDRPQLLSVLKEQMQSLASFKKKTSIHEITKITLTGEVYVRRDDFSRRHLVEKLAQQGILVKTSPLGEWLNYVNFCISHDLSGNLGLLKRLAVKINNIITCKDEEAVHPLLGLSGFYEGGRVDVEYLVARGSNLINPQLTGEAVLTVSSALADVGDKTHGVIILGPFGCMPCRIAESILNCRLVEEKEKFSRDNRRFWAQNKGRFPLPVLAIESDGKAYPQVVEARLESLIISAHRLKRELNKASSQSQ